MGKYIGYANGGSYGYKTPGGYTSGDGGSTQFYAGIYGKDNKVYYSIIHFPAINEGNKNLVIQNAKIRILQNAEGPCGAAQVWVTSSDDKYSTEGVLAETVSVTSSSNFTTINLNSAGCNKIAECHAQGKPFYLRLTGTSTERYRFVGYQNYSYSNYDHYGAPMLEFDYSYGASTGTLNSNSITLGDSISLTVKSLSDSYTHTLEWYLDDKLLGSQNQTGSGSPGNFSYPTSLATSTYFSPTSNISQGKVVLTTKWNNTAIGTATYYFNVNIGNNALPTMSKPSFIFQDGGSTNRGYCLQNFSSVYCTASASGSAGASIQKIQVVVTGAVSGNFSFASNLSNRKLDISLSNAGTVTVTVTATDSRGKTSSNSNSFNVESYFPPSITSMNFYRCNESGAATAEGTYVRGTAKFNYSTTRSNTVSFSERKIDNTDLTNSIMSLNTTTKEITLSTYQITSSLATIKFTIKDNFGSEVSKEFSVSGINYLMHFRDGAIGIGSPASNDNALTIGWPIKFANGYLSDAPARNLILTKATGLNNGINNETHDIIFERPDDGIYEGRLNMIGEGYRFYAYHKDTPDSNPISIMNLDIPNKRLSVGEITLTKALSPAYGGTGYTSLQAARNAMGLGNTTGALPVENGGTGATNAADALKNLGITYSSSKPAENSEINGKIWLQPITL